MKNCCIRPTFTIQSSLINHFPNWYTKFRSRYVALTADKDSNRLNRPAGKVHEIQVWRAGGHAFPIIKKCETLVLESFGSVHSSQLCVLDVHMSQINLVLNYYLAIDLSTVKLS